MCMYKTPPVWAASVWCGCVSLLGRVCVCCCAVTSGMPMQEKDTTSHQVVSVCAGLRSDVMHEYAAGQ